MADDCPSDCDRHVTCRQRDYDGPMEQDRETGEWVPSCPLPLYVRSWRTMWRWRYRCGCGVPDFKTERAYRQHWRVIHRPLRKFGGGWVVDA